MADKTGRTVGQASTQTKDMSIDGLVRLSTQR